MMNGVNSRQNEVWWPWNLFEKWVWIFETLTRFLGNTDDWIIYLIRSAEKEARDVVLLVIWRYGLIIIMRFFNVEFQRFQKSGTLNNFQMHSIYIHNVIYNISMVPDFFKTLKLNIEKSHDNDYTIPSKLQQDYISSFFFSWPYQINDSIISIS